MGENMTSETSCQRFKSGVESTMSRRITVPSPIRLQTTFNKEKKELFSTKDSMVKELIIHPEYSPKRIFNNLAILITESNFVYQKHIGPVCLPKPNENFEGQVKYLQKL